MRFSRLRNIDLRQRRRALRMCGVVLAVLVLTVLALPAAAIEPPAPLPETRCPVCGMFVVKHPDWIASIVFRDGTAQHFDGPKDMFRFYLDIEKYGQGKTHWDIAELFVTDYYTLGPITAREAYFIRGSDVLGPMGAELIPVAGEDAAKSFLSDHRGSGVLRFSEIGKAELDTLE